MEEWRDIPGYEGYYQASDLGNIRSVARLVKHHKGGLSLKKGIVLSQANHTKGYQLIYLWREGNSNGYLVHRLVAKAFIANPFNLPEVNHKDCNKKNNRKSNLEWMTGQDNVLHSVRNGTFGALKKNILLKSV